MVDDDDVTNNMTDMKRFDTNKVNIDNVEKEVKRNIPENDAVNDNGDADDGSEETETQCESRCCSQSINGQSRSCWCQ